MTDLPHQPIGRGPVIDAVDFYTRPGCAASAMLWRGLHRRGIALRPHDIWADPEAAARVRATARGNETVPTVAIGTTVLVNPRVADVALTHETIRDQPMIALVTDSNAMLPAELTARLGVRIVPLTVVVDGASLVEDEALDLPGFYSALRRGAVVTTSAPSPGLLAETYVELAGAGATEIVSVHVGSSYSGTVNAAQVGARLAPVPVHIVDSGTASFALGCCVWAAADDLACGGDSGSAMAAAKTVTDATTSVFTVGEIERARAGGRIQIEAARDGVPVVAMTPTGIETIGGATDVETAIEQMTRFLDRRLSGPVRVGIGDADDPDAADALAEALSGLDQVDELVRYRCGPTVAAHTGAGTFGAVAWDLGR